VLVLRLHKPLGCHTQRQRYDFVRSLSSLAVPLLSSLSPPLLFAHTCAPPHRHLDRAPEPAPRRASVITDAGSTSAYTDVTAQSQCHRTGSRRSKTWILKNRDQRLTPKIARLLAKNMRSSATETRRWLANPRNSRSFFRETGDGQKWRHWSAGVPGFELGNDVRKMPFEMSGGFRLIPEHTGTRDFSRIRC
jgi:hypothetical protein